MRQTLHTAAPEGGVRRAQGIALEELLADGALERMPFRAVATRYFPDVIPEVASRKLKRLIKDDGLMLHDLMAEGYQPTQRHLRREHIALLIVFLGTPEEFQQYR